MRTTSETYVFFFQIIIHNYGIESKRILWTHFKTSVSIGNPLENTSKHSSIMFPQNIFLCILKRKLLNQHFALLIISFWCEVFKTVYNSIFTCFIGLHSWWKERFLNLYFVMKYEPYKTHFSSSIFKKFMFFHWRK